ncbi:hypothetical protein VTN00DRAFT_5639 [Thermoascus crustaceus]|uniref:uncharacterized protein n=1 Tax=Thermoascus crustaceus TaxID=5088 RepID=UPI003743AA08
MPRAAVPDNGHSDSTGTWLAIFGADERVKRWFLGCAARSLVRTQIPSSLLPTRMVLLLCTTLQRATRGPGTLEMFLTNFGVDLLGSWPGRARRQARQGLALCSRVAASA